MTRLRLFAVGSAIVSLAATCSLSVGQEPAAGKPAKPVTLQERVDVAPPAILQEPTERLVNDWRAQRRASVDPLFAELAVTDPALACVVLESRTPLPLDLDPETIKVVRGQYALLPPLLPQEVTEHSGSGIWDQPPVHPPKPPEGYRGNQVKVAKPDDPLQKKASELFAKLPVPVQRSKHYEKAWKHLRFDGWYIFIMDAKPTNGAVVVTVHSEPLASSAISDRNVRLSGSTETYELKDNALKLLKFAPNREPPTGEPDEYGNY